MKKRQIASSFNWYKLQPFAIVVGLSGMEEGVKWLLFQQEGKMYSICIETAPLEIFPFGEIFPVLFRSPKEALSHLKLPRQKVILLDSKGI